MQTKTQPAPWRIFISSTYEDMLPYREAVSDALTSIEHLPIGMEQFVSTPDRSLDVCLTDVRRCQLYVVLVGMRYGSIDDETGKSFTELEYEEALKNNIPVLAFVINENECPVLPKFVDTGVSAEKLKHFKNRLDERMTSRFTSVEHLKELVIRSVEAQVKRTTEAKQAEALVSADEEDFVAGAKLFKRFILLPERYKGKEAILRIKMDGGFSGWRLRDAMFDAFHVKNGDSILGNDATVIGIDFSDIDEKARIIDFFAEGKNADWLLDNGITNGMIFEGRFRFLYETVESRSLEDSDIKIAMLLLLEGIRVIGPDSQYRSRRKNR
mgnify:FL=1